MPFSTIIVDVDGVPLMITLKKHARQKHLRLIAHADGSLVVSVPRSCTHAMAQAFVRDNIAWVRRQRDVMAQASRRVTVDPCVVQLIKTAARPIIAQRITHFNAIYGFTYTAVHIRHQKTRWGSCSGDGVLSFNCALLGLPPSLRDYIVVHELCHLWEMNHSPRFWALVARAIPDYAKRRTQLKRMRPQ